jgi:putative chitinase
MINEAAFFKAIRPIFGGSFSQPQVDGINKILDEWERLALIDLRWLAYIFATVKLETGAVMQPINEKGSAKYFAKYDPPGKLAKMLGNTQKGDGPKYHGRGPVQLTGRANYTKATKKFGADFINKPELALDPRYAWAITFDGMIEGWFTGKKLSDYFNATKTDWRHARQIINSMDRADDIAADAKRFLTALTAASAPETAVNSLDVAPPPPPPPPTPTKSPTNWIAALGAGVPALATTVKGLADTTNSTVTQVNDSAGSVKNAVTVIRDSTNTWAGWINWHLPPSVLVAVGIIGLLAVALVIYRHSRLLKDAAA